MSTDIGKELESLRDAALKRDPHQAIFHQALLEITESLRPFLESLDEESKAKHLSSLKRLSEPERVLTFRVVWTDRAGEVQVNRGWRVIHSTACGPGKGGLRFRDGVTLGELKFLALEQTLKNALTGIPLGGSKGGSDFNPRGKTDAEVIAFCQAFMSALHGSIGPDVDVPAGDIGVGAREIGALYGQYKRITRRSDGAMTGKAPSFGGSLIRTEATGYGAVMFLGHVLAAAGKPLEGRRCLVSGSGNVALHAAKKLIAVGAVVASLSDSDGTLFFTSDGGCTAEELSEINDFKTRRRGRLSELPESESREYVAGVRPWVRGSPGAVAFPCATQNEIDEATAKTLIDAGVVAVAEGANMPTTNEGIAAFLEGNVLVCPAKACNAGGVAVSGLEMSQNGSHIAWTAEEVEHRLEGIMKHIFDACDEASTTAGKKGNYVVGANIAGFLKVSEAIQFQGPI